MHTRNLLRPVIALIGTCISSAITAQNIQTFAGGGLFKANPALQISLPFPIAIANVSGSIDIGLASTSGPQVSVVQFSPNTNQVTTIAGSGFSGYSGDGGPALNARLATPEGLAGDSAGNVYIADDLNHVVRMVSAATGTITTIAGNGNYGYSGDGGPATSAELGYIFDVAVDAAGDVFIADDGNSVVRMVAAATGVITTVAGNGTQGYSGDGGPATSASLNGPGGLAIDGAGDLYIADTGNSAIRMVSRQTGNISTVAGTGTYGYTGDGGPATAAELFFPARLAIDGSNNLYICDNGNAVIRLVTAATGTITTYAGNGNQTSSGDGGPATSAGLTCEDVALDASGNLYIADAGNNALRVVAAGTGIITTVAGNGYYSYWGDGGLATNAGVLNPAFTAVDPSGNIYFSDSYNYVVRKVAASTGIVTTVAGNGTYGYTGDGGPASAAQLGQPWGLAFDANGNLYIADQGNEVVREVSGTTGIITTVAGNGTYGYSGDGGPATSAELSVPIGIALDGSGNLYISDGNNFVVRMVTAATGVMTTFAGNGTMGYSGDGGPAASASLNNPGGLAVDGAGDLIIADAGNGRVREVSVATGNITTIAGDGCTNPFGKGPPCPLGDGGPATSALLSGPGAVALDRAGNLYITDSGDERIRMVSGATGIISTVAGTGVQGFSGDGGPGTAAQMNGPLGLALDASGNLYFADLYNDRLREVVSVGSSGSPPPTITPTVTGTLGTNGWYTSNVQVSWAVNGNGTAITSQSGCATTTIATDTTGRVVTCSATNAGGTSAQSVTIKRDATAPVIAISTPANGATYPQGTVVNANYSCSDATSGVASCSGTTASGAPINTATQGGQSFIVNATDAAGNSAMASTNYTITAPIVSFTLAPGTLGFGNQAVNIPSSSASITLSNTGTTALPLTSIALTGSNPGQFSQTNTCGNSVPQGGGCTISIVFLPTSAGAKSASLTVTAGSGGGTHAVALTGMGVDTSFSLSPGSLAFGSQEITVASSMQAVTLTNSGAVALPITNIALTGGSAAQFAESTTCGSSVPVGAHCSISVNFTPTSVGSKSASLKVSVGGGAAAQTVSLSGTGTDPTYTLVPASLAFGNQQTNVASAAQTATVTNTSAVALPVTNIALAGGNAGQFSQTNTCGASIPAGSGCSIAVIFLPTSTGAKSATLTINLGGGAGVQSASLSGTGVVPTYTLAPTSIAFGNQAHGTQSAPQTLTLTNTSTLTLSITSIALSGGNTAQFGQSNSCGSSVAAGANCTISVTFDPTSKGAKTSSLKVTAGAGAGSQTTSLAGTGT
jgi:trimeric autotransporter adhesin